MNKAQREKIWFQWERMSASAPARFARYGPLDRAALLDDEIGEAALDALAKVAWNTALAEALTPVLQAVEIGLRNWIDKAMRQYRANHFKDPNATKWLLTANAWLHVKDRELLERARTKLQDEVNANKRTSFGHDDLLATASFALWSNMILSNDVWQALADFQKGTLTAGETRKSLHKTFDDMRNLRNRAYHLEPIFSQPDLWDVYQAARARLTIVDPRLSKLIAALDRFPQVYDNGSGWQHYRSMLFLHYELDRLKDL